MKTVTQTVNFTSAEEVANAIENENFPTRQIDNEAFFIKYPNGEYVLRKGANIQVRDEEVDLEFVERQVNKRTPKKCRKKTIIFFPSDVYDTDGTLFAREGDLKINNGTHTAYIQMGLGVKTSQDYIVNFDTQLGGKISEAINLGNLLNRNDVERQGCKKNHVKQIVLQMMSENEKDNGNAELTEEQISKILSQYNFINRHTIGQWKSHHSKVGGRRKPLKVWTNVELTEKWQHFADLEQYQEFIILEAREVSSWKQTTVSTLVNYHLADDNYIDGSTKKDKFLFIFYCKSQAQVDDLTRTKTEMREYYHRMEQRYGIEIKTEFLRHS